MSDEPSPVRSFERIKSGACVADPLAGAEGTGRVLANATTDGEGLAEVPLPVDAVFPMGGRFRLSSPEGAWLTKAVQAEAAAGMYPGDFYAIDPA